MGAPDSHVAGSIVIHTLSCLAISQSAFGDQRVGHHGGRHCVPARVLPGDPGENCTVYRQSDGSLPACPARLPYGVLCTHEAYHR